MREEIDEERMDINGPSSCANDVGEEVQNDEMDLELFLEKMREAFEITISDRQCESIHAVVEKGDE